MGAKAFLKEADNQPLKSPLVIIVFNWLKNILSGRRQNFSYVLELRPGKFLFFIQMRESIGPSQGTASVI